MNVYIIDMPTVMLPARSLQWLSPFRMLSNLFQLKLFELKLFEIKLFEIKLFRVKTRPVKTLPVKTLQAKIAHADNDTCMRQYSTN